MGMEIITPHIKHMNDNYAPGWENHPSAPWNQEPEEVQEEDPRDELYQEMVDFLEKHGSSVDTLELKTDGWFYRIANVERGSYEKLPTKFWLVAQD